MLLMFIITLLLPPPNPGNPICIPCIMLPPLLPPPPPPPPRGPSSIIMPPPIPMKGSAPMPMKGSRKKSSSNGSRPPIIPPSKLRRLIATLVLRWDKYSHCRSHQSTEASLSLFSCFRESLPAKAEREGVWEEQRGAGTARLPLPNCILPHLALCTECERLSQPACDGSGYRRHNGRLLLVKAVGPSCRTLRRTATCTAPPRGTCCHNRRSLRSEGSPIGRQIPPCKRVREEAATAGFRSRLLRAPTAAARTAGRSSGVQATGSPHSPAQTAAAESALRTILRECSRAVASRKEIQADPARLRRRRRRRLDPESFQRFGSRRRSSCRKCRESLARLP